jgi:ERCC4-related helicase
MFFYQSLVRGTQWSRNVKTQIGPSATDAQIDALEHAGSMNSREQQRIIARLQTGHVSLLFATDVAEEGLDIQRCNSVVRLQNLCTARFV